MTLNRSLQLVGLAKQSARGTPAANPTFSHGVAGGTVGGIDITQERAPLTSASRTTPLADRTEASGGMGDYSFRAHTKTIGLYLYGVLGALATTGAGPYVHTITDSTAIPYMTLFGKYGGSIIQSIQDCRIDELVLSWDEAGPVTVEVTIVGTLPNFSATFSATTDESRAQYFSAAGGTFKLDTDSATPVTARVKGGRIAIRNQVEAVVLSASLIPGEQMEGNVEIDFDLTIVPDTDLADWRTVVTGSAAGASISEVPIYGSAEVQFNNGADSLKFTSSRVGFITDFPEADPGGGPAELELTGMVVQPSAGGASLTAVLTNTQVSY